MNMKMTKILTALLLVALVLSLAACSKPQTNGGNMATEDNAANAIDDLLAKEASTAEEATALHTQLMDAETAILNENSALWEKVFLSADKGSAMIEDGSNYGDFLLKTIESAKDEFTEDELKLLQKDGETIRSIEVKVAALQEKFPGCGQMPSGDGTSVPAGDNMMTPPDDGSLQKFPAFEGKDLDGNEVKSDTLFSGNAVTVVNFWFTTCNPCVGELAELDALNKELAEKGGDVYAYMDALAEAEPAGSEGLCFPPYPGGESTPHVDPNARGVFFGLSYRHNLGAMCRSVMEGVTFSLRDILEIIHETNNLTVTEVRAMGGGAKSALWRQIQADVYNASVITMNMDEGPAAGAAILAAVAAGEFPSVEEGCRHILKPVTQTQPIAENVGVYDDFYGTYRKLYPALKPLYQEQAQKVAKYLE